MARALARARGALPSHGAQAERRALKPRAVDTAYRKAFDRIVQRVQRALEGAPARVFPIRMYVAGGAALHLLTGARVTEDVDATFSKKVMLGDDIQVSYRDPDGRARMVYLDRNYNDTLGLLHADAYRDSRAVAVPGVDSKRLQVRVLAPADLAVSKLARFTDQDREDIELLARLGLVDSATLRRRAEEALEDYVGDPATVRISIDVACRLIDSHRPRKTKKKRH